jgi:hypothetical protein
LFELYAEWGVDFIKVDDTMYPVFHEKEIGLVSQALKACGRPMVLSLSLGEIPHARAEFLTKNAHMWRISDDFWDNWSSIEHAFDLLDAWSPHISPDHWPDADMLPIGHICLNDQPNGEERMSRLTAPEHCTLMTLWAIARSPLMIGSDLPTIPESTLVFLTNKEVLEVNQNSTNNRLVYKDWSGNVIWMADVPDSDDRYLAMFNILDKKRSITFNFDLEYIRRPCLIRDLWVHKELGIFEKAFSAEIQAHGSGLYRISPK